MFCLEMAQDSSESNEFTYLKPKLNIGSKYEVTVCYSTDMTDFYVQLTHFDDQQDRISSILNSGYKFIPISFTACTSGKPVCVKYSEDDLWYRAKIVTAKNENDISVFFVDYGNYDNVSLSAICNMNPDVLKFPIQAFKCFLLETSIPSDTKVKDDALHLFSSLTDDHSLVAHVRTITDESSYGLTLFEKNVVMSINEKIMSLVPSISDVLVNDIENILVTSFKTTSSFFAQLEKLDSDKFIRMHEEINLFYDGRQNTTYIPAEGDLVCARFDLDGVFYRAKVKKYIYGLGLCEVFFIDFGNKGMVPLKDVHLMDLSFTNFSQFGIQCTLNNALSGICDNEICELMLDNSFQVKIVHQQGNKWLVSLTDSYANNDPVLQLLKKKDNFIPCSIYGADDAIASREAQPSCSEKRASSTQTDPITPDFKTTRPQKNNATSENTNFQAGAIASQTKINKFLEVMSSDIEKIYDLDYNTDCVLKVDNERFKAHRTILSARSPVFKAMFHHHTLESSSGEVDITDIQAETLRDVLRYIYSGKIEGLNPGTAASMYAAADKYTLIDLKGECLEFLIKNITLDNICDAAELAHLHAEGELEKEVVAFIKSRLSEIMDSDKWKKLFVEHPLLVHKYLSAALHANI